MARIIRNSITHDPSGRPLLGSTHRLIDDGRGNIVSYRTRRSIPCPNCRRQITGLDQARGLCNWCGLRHTCDHCDAICKVCSRRLCGSCRRGFAGDRGLITVCPHCLKKLLRRQVRNDHLNQQQAELRMRHFVQQEHARRTALYIQAARFRANQRLAARREANRMRLAVLRHGSR